VYDPFVACVIITEGPEIGRHLDLEQHELVLVGRDLTCTFPIADKSVSRRHLQLKSIPAAKNHMAIDFGSSNGTFINEVRISQPTEVKDGDVIRIGDTVMIYMTDTTSIAERKSDLEERLRAARQKTFLGTKSPQ
jgi:pSer/pThr/pTyr-binding forkhead associated (FHA) protein